MLRSRNAQSKDQNSTEMTKDEIKYAELGIELEKLTMRLKKDNGFLKHLKKMAKAHEVEYEE